MFTPREEPRGVAFGTFGTGYHEAGECRRAADWLAECIERCMDEDVRGDAEPALAYLEHKMSAREFLPGQLRKALCNPDPAMRHAGAHRLLRQIERNIPRHWIEKER